VERQIPDLVNGVVPAVLTLTQLTAILRALLREGITTRHLDVALQIIAESGSKLGERQLLAEIRVALAPVISSRLAQGGVIRGAVVEPVIDLVLGKAEERGSLVPAELVDQICEQVGDLVSTGAVVVASKRARAYLRDIIRVRWNDIPIIAHEEIGKRFRFESIGQVIVASDEQRHALVNSL
jgi:flagellar biosynthesis protein FlhA